MSIEQTQLWQFPFAQLTEETEYYGSIWKMRLKELLLLRLNAADSDFVGTDLENIVTYLVSQQYIIPKEIIRNFFNIKEGLVNFDWNFRNFSLRRKAAYRSTLPVGILQMSVAAIDGPLPQLYTIDFHYTPENWMATLQQFCQQSFPTGLLTLNSKGIWINFSRNGVTKLIVTIKYQGVTFINFSFTPTTEIDYFYIPFLTSFEDYVSFLDFSQGGRKFSPIRDRLIQMDVINMIGFQIRKSLLAYSNSNTNQQGTSVLYNFSTSQFNPFLLNDLVFNEYTTQDKQQLQINLSVPEDLNFGLNFLSANAASNAISCLSHYIVVDTLLSVQGVIG